MGFVADVQATRSTLLSVDTTLSEDITATQNYIPVVSTTDFSTSVVAEIESTNEVVSFTDISENAFTYSQDLTNWSGASNVTVTSNATTAPDGTLTADSFQTITTGSFSYVSNDVNATSFFAGATPLTLSFYVKGTGFIQLLTNTVWVGNGYVNVNCATGETFVGSVFTGVKTFDVGNGWWKIQMSAPAAGSLLGGLYFAVVDAISSARASASNDTSLRYIWGVQWERVPNGVINTTGGSNTSTYLPTTTTALVGLTAVTRGVNGTTAQAASSGDSIQQLPYALGSLDLPIRLKALSVSSDGNGAGRLTLCDNNGDSLCDVDFANDTIYTLTIPEDGIIFPNGIFVSNTDNVEAYTLFTDAYSAPGLTTTNG